ncbi:MAG TPA: glycosyltransferase family 4 protein [Pyrinomonadaceae bacterium]|jgi:glycosyltransferase involved in cell wall biosynthesis|nr:glycosyltransferase family 4 protein [Pyrinomonadaceae bacterium]
MSGRQIVMVVSGFPRRSETFALGELLALEERRALFAVFATKPGDGESLQPGCERLMKHVRFLPEGSPAEQAAFIVKSCAGQFVGGIHGYFAHTPAEVAAHAAARLGVPYGFSCHARDARKVSPSELAERARRAACVVACNTDVACEIQQSGAPVHLLPHGVDLQRFRPQPVPHAGTLRLLAVGRLVEKKGFHILLDAAARLKFPFRLRIVGCGPEEERLSNIIKAKGLVDRVTLDGAMTHAELPCAYASAHIVVVPSIQDKSGDRDGLPNVVLEAMASGRAVIASRISAIGSAVTHGETGMLVPPVDPVALADALEKLNLHPALREHFSRNGRARVERDYEVGRCTERFHRLLENVYA